MDGSRFAMRTLWFLGGIAGVCVLLFLILAAIGYLFPMPEKDSSKKALAQKPNHDLTETKSAKTPVPNEDKNHVIHDNWEKLIGHYSYRDLILEQVETKPADFKNLRSTGRYLTDRNRRKGAVVDLNGAVPINIEAAVPFNAFKNMSMNEYDGRQINTVLSFKVVDGEAQIDIPTSDKTHQTVTVKEGDAIRIQVPLLVKYYSRYYDPVLAPADGELHPYLVGSFYLTALRNKPITVEYRIVTDLDRLKL